MRYGCIGEHLSHSMSVEVHKAISGLAGVGEYEYRLCELAPDMLDGFFANADFDGINVTIPYKQSIIKYLDFIDKNAEDIGAVNTVVKRDGRLYGYNTDFDGMSALVRKNCFDFENAKVMILGSGGTSLTAYHVALSLGAKCVLRVSRNPSGNCISYSEMYGKHTDADFIINTTPVGMFGQLEDDTPIDLSMFGNIKGVIDAVYNPLKTKLILQAGRLGIKAVGGLYMLVSQAVSAAEKFFDCNLGNIADRVYGKVLSQAQNIVLIGMPGCGKSTVGRLIAERTGRCFYDTDSEIQAIDGRNIPEIFEKDGEKGFRKLEKQVICGKMRNLHGAVIATGGGAVIDPENAEMLKQNGKVIFIDRPIELITSTDGRPLLKTNTLQELFDKRYPIYKNTADITVENNRTIEEVITQII